MSELRARRMVLDRIAVARKFGSRYHAEADGLLRALCSAEPVTLFSDAEMQQAYMRGFREGREIVRVEDACEAAGHSVGA